MKKQAVIVNPELKYLVVEVSLAAVMEAAQKILCEKFGQEISLKCAYDYDDGSAYLAPKSEAGRIILSDHYGVGSLTALTGALICEILGLEFDPTRYPYVEYFACFEESINKLRIHIPWGCWCVDIIKDKLKVVA